MVRATARIAYRPISSHVLVCRTRPDLRTMAFNLEAIMKWIGLLLAIALGVYLVVALLFPEKFA